LVQKESGKLSELLAEKPLLFRKRLAELDWQIRNNQVKAWELAEIAQGSKVPLFAYT